MTTRKRKPEGCGSVVVSERHHRRSPARRRAHERFDKTLYRLPAPFYRAPDRTIKAGPAAAEVVMLVAQTTQARSEWPSSWYASFADVAIGVKLVREGRDL